LITGASSGIGKTYAIKLAEEKMNLILTARREEKLNSIREELLSKHNIDIKIIVADLSTHKGIDLVTDEIKITNNLFYLINNAGFANIGKFQDIPYYKHQNQLFVHILAPTQLTYAALPIMMKNNAGIIINVASVGAFLKNHYLYGVTKLYLVDFSKLVKKSVEDYNIVVQALCPGFTYTEFHQTEEYTSINKDSYSEIPKFAWTTSEQVVQTSLKAIKKKKTIVIPGLKNRIGIKLLNLGIRILRK
ncbi:MAG: SDR family NAD(P)-dependent oxidoreductase, partial [Candidatus Kariarchaeaceae archaeon]|jgi:short-subunit dehydrogenase